jgi:hypothetical protein
MKACDYHRNVATRQEDLDTTAGDGNGDFTLRYLCPYRENRRLEFLSD